MPTLYGQGLLLREYRAEDYNALCSWVNDWETTRFLSTAYWIPQCDGDCRDYLSSRMRSSHNAYYFVIASPEEERYLGELALYDLNWRLRSGKVSLLVLRACRGQGLGREALRLIREFAFRTLGLERLELEVHAQNEPALRCYEQAGFLREGVKRHAYFSEGQFRDVVLMSALSGD